MYQIAPIATSIAHHSSVRDELTGLLRRMRYKEPPTQASMLLDYIADHANDAHFVSRIKGALAAQEELRGSLRFITDPAFPPCEHSTLPFHFYARTTS